MWIAEVDVPNCPCGSPATITATCHDVPPCTATLNTTLMCNCCPQITTVANQGPWNSSGQQLITFVTQLTFGAGCSVTVQRNFGDGSFGAQHTFTTSPVSYQETHAYTPPANYVSQLDVVSNTTCAPSAPDQVTVSAAAPACATVFGFSACNTIRSLFQLCAGVAAILAIAWTSPVCIAASASLPAFVAGWTIAAAVFFAILYVWCRKCLCGFLVKLFGELFVIVGMVLVMFVLPANCTQPSPFAAPYVVLWAVLVALLFGAAALLNGGWYQQLKAVCPLNVCDYWQAVKDALTIAVVVALVVFFSLGTGVSLTHLGLALLVILISLILVNQQIQINQSAGKC
jgi:hypothetical protein